MYLFLIEITVYDNFIYNIASNEGWELPITSCPRVSKIFVKAAETS